MFTISKESPSFSSFGWNSFLLHRLLPKVALAQEKFSILIPSPTLWQCISLFARLLYYLSIKIDMLYVSLTHIFIFYCHTLNVILKIFPSHCFLSVSSYSRSSCPASLIYPGQDISSSLTNSSFSFEVIGKILHGSIFTPRMPWASLYSSLIARCRNCRWISLLICFLLQNWY